MARPPARLKHRGFTGSLEPSLRDGLVSGEVLGIQKVLRYSGKTVGDAKKAFINVVEEYLASAEGKDGKRPYSGHLNVRIHPEVHRLAAIRAAESGNTMSAWVEGVLRRAGEAEAPKPRRSQGSKQGTKRGS